MTGLIIIITSAVTGSLVAGYYYLNRRRRRGEENKKKDEKVSFPEKETPEKKKAKRKDKTKQSSGRTGKTHKKKEKKPEDSGEIIIVREIVPKDKEEASPEAAGRQQPQEKTHKEPAKKTGPEDKKEKRRRSPVEKRRKKDIKGKPETEKTKKEKPEEKSNKNGEKEEKESNIVLISVEDYEILKGVPRRIKKEDPFTDYKKILYEPNDKFLQTTEIKHYPIVNMPEAGSEVLFPEHGRIRTKGYMERFFGEALSAWFPSGIMINHHLSFIGAANDYEPDFIYKNRKFNLFVDIEIDEPYSGITRKPMHYTGSYDIDRDRYFNQNGWVTIRFAEEQVVRYPEMCGKFIAEVVDSLTGTGLADNFKTEHELPPVKQWTFEEAEKMAEEKYRESYLGITFIEQKEPETGEIETEEEIAKPETGKKPAGKIKTRDTETAHLSESEKKKTEFIKKALEKKQYVKFRYANGLKHLVLPEKVKKKRSVPLLVAYDYVENKLFEFEIRLIDKLQTEENPFVIESDYTNPDEVRKMVYTAIENGQYLRFEYTDYFGEETLRTVGFFDFINTGRNYFSGFCFLRKEQRIFKLERIRHLWVLSLCFYDQLA